MIVFLMLLWFASAWGCAIVYGYKGIEPTIVSVFALLLPIVNTFVLLRCIDFNYIDQKLKQFHDELKNN